MKKNTVSTQYISTTINDTLQALYTLHRSVLVLHVCDLPINQAPTRHSARIFTIARDLLVVLLVLAVIAFVAVLGPLQLQLAPLCECVPSAMFRLRRCDFFLLRIRFSSSCSAKTAASASLVLIFLDTALQRAAAVRKFQKTASYCSSQARAFLQRCCSNAACLLATPCIASC
jgi:hypothetical protein